MSISRVIQNKQVAHVARMGYWFDQDSKTEVERIGRLGAIGMKRKPDSFALAFTWYRRWEDGTPLDVEEVNNLGIDGSGLLQSGHGMNRS